MIQQLKHYFKQLFCVHDYQEQGDNRWSYLPGKYMGECTQMYFECKKCGKKIEIGITNKKR